jgi:hypothetical protein
MFNKKILCIGNETDATDLMVTELALQAGTANYGLITDENFVPENNGYYHTTLADLSPGDIAVKLVSQFDQIQMLDQDQDTYPHWKSFVDTYRLMILLEKDGYNTVFRNNLCTQRIAYWQDQLKTNRALCVLPFINLINDYGSAVMCMKCPEPVTKTELITDWATDPSFAPIRNNMLAGVQMPDKCKICYEREDLGHESARQFESLEWAMQLKLDRAEDLSNIQYPVLYEIRPSNKCNIMCRMCDDRHSHLIEKENRLLGIPVVTDNWKMQAFPYDKINFDTVRRIYWAGGEPTIMPEFYEFLRRCIRQGTTNFELNIGTNAVKISKTLLELLSQFPRVLFSVSFDGYEKMHDYIRWGSEFASQRENCFRILEAGHNISFQTVISMWNATRVHEIFEFYDRDFPGYNCLVQPAGELDSFMGPWHHPLRQQVLESMRRCQDTRVYYNFGRNTNDAIDEIIERFENHDYDPVILAKFFQYNDQLDQARGCKLEDYIPELAQARII